jgi:bifunctional enzyme CysN/CysC
VARLVAPDGDLAEARAGDAVTLVLEDERDVSRGDVLAAAAAPCQVADQFEAQLVWLHERPLVPGRTYRARIHTKGAGATITALKWKLDVDTGARLAARTLGLNEIAAVNVAFDQPVAFAPYAACPGLGAFILVDRLTEETVGAGMIGFALRRAGNIHWQPSRVEAAERAAAMGQRPCCVWLTGLSGAGKSTIAGLLEQRVLAAGGHPYVLDGDNLRHGLNKDLGFTAADRVENMRRVAEVARLMVDAGLVVIASLISPFRAERDWARSRFGPGQFLEVLVTAPFEVCAERDPKGLYAKALRGELPNFTGVDSPYEAPVAPELVLDTTALDPEACVDRLMSYMGWA